MSGVKEKLLSGKRMNYFIAVLWQCQCYLLPKSLTIQLRQYFSASLKQGETMGQSSG
jgi:hypothetical protein